MKDILKYMGLLLVGLAVAIILYPFLHETGYSVTAFLVGAKVIDFNLLPLPYVVCEVSATDSIGQVLIGLDGIIIPFFVSMLLRPKHFWMWYVNLLVKGISTYATLLSVIAIFISMVSAGRTRILFKYYKYSRMAFGYSYLYLPLCLGTELLK